MNFIKTHLIGLIAIALVIGLFVFGGYGNGCNKPGTDTLRTETKIIYEPQPPVILKEYVPVPYETKVPIIIPSEYTPSTDTAELKRQYEAIVKKFLAENKYNETYDLKDSSGNKVGTFNIKDVISENAIKSRQPSYQLSFPHTYTTITVADKYRQLYGGIALTGTPAQIVNGGNVGIAYKDKRDKIIIIKGGVMQNNQQTFGYGEVGVFLPLGKKK